MIFTSNSEPGGKLDSFRLETLLTGALEKLGPRKKVLIVPPDYSRLHSGAGELTALACKYYGGAVKRILPALGTHRPMTREEILKMYGPIPPELFMEHRWREDVVTVGRVPGEVVTDISGGILSFDWPAQLNRELAEGDYDLILSIGQVVPHEIAGMANHSKNLFVGTGGAEGIHKSHFLGAACGMENIMGRPDNPVRGLFNYASDHFIRHLPVVYLLTVVDSLGVCGFFAGNGEECFNEAAELSRQVNIHTLPAPLKKVVVHMDPECYKSTWLANKGIYRTRKAIADGGELIVLAPGVKEFGEDREIDRLIRKYGYRGTPVILSAVDREAELKACLSGAAHLIHGSSEGRFGITYCTGKLTQEEVEGVGYRYMGIDEALKRYPPGKLEEGYNRLSGGEEIYYIANPAQGLWEAGE